MNKWEQLTSCTLLSSVPHPSFSCIPTADCSVNLSLVIAKMEGTICHTVCWNNHPQPPCTLLALLCYQTTECRYKGSDPLRKVTSIEDESDACFSLPSDSPICHRWSERVSMLIFISCIMQECISLQRWRGNICPSRLTQLLTLLLALYTVWQSLCWVGNPLCLTSPSASVQTWPTDLQRRSRSFICNQLQHINLWAVNFSTTRWAFQY